MSMKKEDELDPRLANLLEELKPVPAPDPKAAARARSRFLAQAVSARSEARHSRWNIFQQKEKLAMNLIVSTLIVVGLLFGGGATVAAAQDALPNEALYQVKLARESTQLLFTAEPIERVELLMEQAQTRTDEMLMLAATGTAPDEATLTRAQEHIRQALQLTASLDDAAMTVTLARIQTQLQAQEQQLSQLQDGACADCDPILQQTRDMLRLQLQTVDGGLADPQTFRSQYRNQVRATLTPGVTGTAIPTDTTEVPATPQGSCTPVQDGTGQQNGNGNPPVDGTPVPQDGGNGTGNGGGSGEAPDATPGGNGNGGLHQSTPGGQGGKP
jgi:predicted negative regulator of RcsB-dependent stress response